jgi:protein PhnA
MSEFPPCPQCESIYTYDSGDKLVCPDCGHQWKPVDVSVEEGLVVKDSIGNPLKTGDSIIVTKDLPVKGYSKSIKAGTKVKNIRLTEGDGGHNIDCKIEGFGSMVLKSEFVRKA